MFFPGLLHCRSHTVPCRALGTDVVCDAPTFTVLKLHTETYSHLLFIHPGVINISHIKMNECVCCMFDMHFVSFDARPIKCVKYTNFTLNWISSMFCHGFRAATLSHKYNNIASHSVIKYGKIRWNNVVSNK